MTLVRIPKAFNGQNLSFNSFTNLVEVNLKVPVNISPNVSKNFGDQLVNSPQWVLMTNQFVPKSYNSSYREQSKIVTDLARQFLPGYAPPTLFGAMLSSVAYCLSTGKSMFENNSANQTRCIETVGGRHLKVFGFNEGNGIRIWEGDDNGYETGMAAMRVLK